MIIYTLPWLLKQLFLYSAYKLKFSFTYIKTLLLLFILINSFTIYAEIKTWQLSGIIISEMTSQPIPSAHIKSSSGLIAISDSLGQFQINNIESDSITISVSHTAYKTSRNTIYFGDNNLVKIILTPKNITTKEVKVSAKNPHLSQRTLTGVHNVSQKEILSSPTFLGEADVLQTIKQLPGRDQFGT